MPSVKSAREVFEALLDLPSEARASALVELSGGDQALIVEVKALLGSAKGPSAILGSPTVPLFAKSPNGVLGTRIGPYKLLQLIGEGGFGSVYLAEQDKPVGRKVALKVIKLGMDTKQVIARFEAERQALAMMDHAHIARVLDAGATEHGRPYFVMDLVKGEGIVEYCDKNHLSIPDRLELFAQVCAAVQHAHTKGIVHRDIKPSNILVSMLDGCPHAKVIDFGIAKATLTKLTEKTLFTEHRALIGTPEYMSPEQAEGSLDIDTRTDIYSLGVLLYELLTGTTPFSGKSLRSAAFAEIQRIIREEEPPKPSTRLSQNSDTAASVAANRHTEPKRLGTLVRGELDWIVMKALEKDRSRRYETANGLGMDIRRFLNGEAVVAAPPGAAYRVRKFVRRNKGMATAVGTIVGILVLATGVSVWFGLRESAAREREKARADELKLVIDFQANMLGEFNPALTGDRLSVDVIHQLAEALEKDGLDKLHRDTTVREFGELWEKINATDVAKNMIDATVLKPAVDAINKRFKDQPTLDARLRQELADLYVKIGRYDVAKPLQVQALDIRCRELGDEHRDTATSKNSMGYLLQSLSELEQAEPYYRAALRTRQRVLGEEDPETLTSLNDVGRVLRAQQRLAEAEPCLREALDKRRRVLGNDSREVLESLNDLGLLLYDQRRIDEAEACFQELIQTGGPLYGETDPEVLTARLNMGRIFQTQGKNEQAESYFRDVVQKSRRVLGDEHSDTLIATHSLGELLLRMGRRDEAEPLARENLPKYRRLLGNTHQKTLSAINFMANVLREQGNLAEAESLYREVLHALRDSPRKEEHPLYPAALNRIGTVLDLMGRPEDAEPYLIESLQRMRKTKNDTDRELLYAINCVVSVLIDNDKCEAAEPLAREAIEKCEHRPPEDTYAINAVYNMGLLLQVQGNLHEALPFVKDALEKRRRLGPRRPETIRAIGTMGELFRKLGKHIEAESLFREAMKSAHEVLGPERPETLVYTNNLGEVLRDQRRYDDVVSLLTPIENSARKAFVGGHTRRLGVFLTTLGRARVGLGFSDEAFSIAEANLHEAHAILAKAKRAKVADRILCLEGIVDLYKSWHAGDPGKGYDKKAAEWKTEMKAMQTQRSTNSVDRSK